MASYTKNSIRYFSIRKNVAGAKSYDIKVKLKPSYDPQIGSIVESYADKDSSYAERTSDGGGEFKFTIIATGDGKGGYINISTLESLFSYKGQLALVSLSDFGYTGTYIVTNAKYTENRGKLYKNLSGLVVQTSSVYEIDVTLKRVVSEEVTYPSANATNTPSAVKQNNTTKSSLNWLSAKYQKYYTNCPTLSYTNYHKKKGVECVKTTQTLLKKNNYYLGYKTDGWFDVHTRNAVIKFKKKKKITPYNSVVNKKVRLALLQVLKK